MSIICDIHRDKEYREETLHLAVSIVDRYLAILGNAQQPILLHLALTAILMAAKLE